MNQFLANTMMRSSLSVKLEERNVLEELQISPTDQADRNELEHILKNILGYPSSDLAYRHRDCNKLGPMDLRDEHQNKLSLEQMSQLGMGTKFCTCCGFVKQEANIKVCTRIKDVTNIGVSTSMYFRALIVLVVLLILMFVIYSMFSLCTNIVASSSYVGVKDPTMDTTHGILALSLGSKQLNATEENSAFYEIQSWFGLGMLVFWVGFLIAAKGFERRSVKRIREESYSAADFSIIIENVPQHITQQDLQRSFRQYAIRAGIQSFASFKIEKINIGRPFYLHQEYFKDEKIEKLNKDHREMLEIFSSWVKERQSQSGFSTSQAERNIAYAEFKKIKEERLIAYREISQKVIADFEKSGESSTYTAFVTFETNRDKEIFLSFNQDNVRDRIMGLFWCCTTSSRFDLRDDTGNVMQVSVGEAPEPEDIIWTNLGHSDGERIKRKMITYFMTFLLLGVSFGVVYGLSVAQVGVKEKNQVLSLLISVVISGFNILIQMIIRALTAYERDFTETNHQATLAFKSVFATLINSILLPILINYLIKKNLYGVNGLAEDIFFLGITNAFLAPLLKIIDLNFIFSRIMAWWKNRSTSRLGLSQQQLNKATEYMVFEAGYEYIYPVNLFLFTCFFVSLQPIIALFSMTGLFLMYWAQKNSIYYRCKRPVPGTTIINNTMFQIIYLGGIFYSLGSLSWSSFFPEGVKHRGLIPNLISLGLSLIIFLLPYETIFRCLYNDQNDESEMKFQDYRIYLPSEYDRLNPSTSEKAVKEFMEFIKTYKEKVKDENELKKMQSIFLKQMGRGRQTNNVLPHIGILDVSYSDNNNVLQQIFSRQTQVINPLMLGASILPHTNNVGLGSPTLWNQIIGNNRMDKQLENALLRKVHSQIGNTSPNQNDIEELDPYTNNIFQQPNQFSKLFNLDNQHEQVNYGSSKPHYY